MALFYIANSSYSLAEEKTLSLKEESIFYASQSAFKKAHECLDADIQYCRNYDKDALAESYLLLGNLFRLEGNYKLAQKSIQKGFRLLSSSSSKNNLAKRLAAAFNYLALLDNSMGLYSDSESNARKALSYAKEGNLDEQTTARHSVVLANALRQQGKYTEALPILESITPKLFHDEKNKELYGTALNNLGALYFWLGNYQKAFQTLEDALKYRISLYGEDHVDVANSFMDIACTEYRLGAKQKAADDLSKSLKIREKLLGLKHPETLASKANLAVVLESMGNYDDALKLLKEVISDASVALGKNHPDLAKYEEDYANVLNYQRKTKLALQYLNHSLIIRKKVFGKKSREFAGGLSTLAQIELSNNLNTLAISHLNESISIYKLVGQKADQDYADALDMLANVYLEAGNLEKSLLVFKQAIEQRQSGLNSLAKAIEFANISEILIRLHKENESIENLLQAKKVIESLPEFLQNDPDAKTILHRCKNLSVRE